MNIAV